uniref:Photosystem I reaction center subunit XII n=2 Tax=Euglena TaxID=3038 RepID=PSAM_EUGGA|nr:RecName: Full=Photosystem I reaction center subunit XII; AltName: Full=PSI-M [Euglena granulata]Q9MS59.1 RecName: Full=Photosystem I reaction center subunit XII; AltName: Full=PSI-M [Euglena sanguinea]AAF82456.1 photosystem I protein M [Euglena sanguinea]ABB02345.1 photosystem I protein M [Euglena granulata]
MAIDNTQIFIALLTALIPAFFALKLGKELSK